MNLTTDQLTWHSQAINQLSQRFEREPQALAFVLVGSLICTDNRADEWSDVDAKVILTDAAIDRYFHSTDWLAPFGRLIGVERHDSQTAKTLRLCLEGFQRFDLSFIAESALRSPALWQDSPFYPAYQVLWSRFPDLETCILTLPTPGPYQALTENEISQSVDAFWYKAAAAIVKVARNDLLIGLHLALDLARDCLVLQMLRRDAAMQTNIHRLGGWGNDLVARFALQGQDETGEAILNLIQQSCEIYDSLARQMLPAYSPRTTLLYPALETARRQCRERA